MNNKIWISPEHRAAARAKAVELKSYIDKLDILNTDIEQAGPRMESIEDAIDSLKQAIMQIADKNAQYKP